MTLPDPKNHKFQTANQETCADIPPIRALASVGMKRLQTGKEGLKKRSKLHFSELPPRSLVTMLKGNRLFCLCVRELTDRVFKQSLSKAGATECWVE